MLWPFEIVIAFVVSAIDRAGHDVNVAFPFRFRFGLFNRGVDRFLTSSFPLSLSFPGADDAAASAASACFNSSSLRFLLFLFGQVLRVRRAGEHDRFTVRRPARVARAFRAAYVNGKRIAAGHREHEKLRRLEFTILLGRAREHDIFSIGRPARGRIAFAAGQAMRDFVASG